MKDSLGSKHGTCNVNQPIGVEAVKHVTHDHNTIKIINILKMKINENDHLIYAHGKAVLGVEVVVTS